MTGADNRGASVAAWALCATAAGLYATAMAVGARHGVADLVDGAVWMGAFLTFAFVGALLAWRRPRNVLGWLLLLVAISEQVAGVGVVYAETLRASGATVGRLSGFALFVSMVAWTPGALVLLVLVPLIFPTGRPPTPRWRWVGWLGGLAVALLVVPTAVAFLPHPQLQLLGWEEAAAALGNPWLLRLSELAFPLLLAAGVLSVASLIVRYARSRGDERQQLKWFAYAAVLTLAFVLVTNLLPIAGSVERAVGAVAIPSIAVAIAVAVLRYRLYEIDRIISRTVSYALLTGLLVAVYLAGVFTLQQVLRPVTGDSQVAVAGATLTVAALFQPARRRIQTLVDRRFNRARYDAQHAVADLRRRLRAEVDLDELGTELLHAVNSTVAPSRASLWLRPAERG